jgi:DNA-binding NtrC family response regulator
MMNQIQELQQLLRPASETMTVLVVDDYPGVADVVRTMLESIGCEVWLAASAESALELLPQRDWDVLVTDLHMPGLSGLDLLRRRDPALPAILMSAQELHGLAFELRRLNAVSLQKPFSPAQLIELVLNAGHGQPALGA